ncbi:MAG: hypothetical protein JRG92_12810 [Deltaproteobacteria bacterium]|nr:hypothetical protein [Deltaproteobacteria bacterium]MBW2384511.1 hypothetical protein [Deltaproteobacteria bacterium]MBW2696815.1 hypothetical protein [Deltaproteobacteria bacterium]
MPHSLHAHPSRLLHATNIFRTSRRVNLLESRVAPGLASEMKRIGSTLERREREEQLRYRRRLERPRSRGPANPRPRI